MCINAMSMHAIDSDTKIITAIIQRAETATNFSSNESEGIERDAEV